MDKFNSAIEPLWVFLHRGHIVRRAVLIMAVWMTWDSYHWAKWYAMTDDPNQFIYAAVLGVPSALLAAAIKFYNSGRSTVPVKDE
jgi:hypothetical protein